MVVVKLSAAVAVPTSVSGESVLVSLTVLLSDSVVVDVYEPRMLLPVIVAVKLSAAVVVLTSVFGESVSVSFTVLLADSVVGSV